MDLGLTGGRTREDVKYREYHTPTMREVLAELRAKMDRSNTARARKDYYQLRDYLESMGPEEWGAECEMRGRRKRRA